MINAMGAKDEKDPAKILDIPASEKKKRKRLEIVAEKYGGSKPSKNKTIYSSKCVDRSRAPKPNSQNPQS